MGIQGGCPGHFIFFFGQQAFQFGVFRIPGGVAFIKSLRDTAPTDIPGQGFLLFRRCLPVFCFDGFQGTDCRHIVGILGFLTAFTQMIVCDSEVFCRNFRNAFCFYCHFRLFGL